MLRRLSKRGIDAKTTGVVQIGTTENGTQRFYPLFAVFVISGASAIIAVPIVSLGITGALYNDILALTTLTGLTALNTSLQVPLTLLQTSIAPNTPVSVNIGTGATAATCLLDVYLFGFYQ